jgi:hypothetical protein
MVLAQNPALWFAPIVLVLLAGGWIGVLSLVSAISGWRKLARSYPAVDTSAPTQDAAPVPRFHFCSASFSGLNYSACLTFAVDRDYLHLATQLPFRPGHPPISIPWSEISATEKKAFLNSGTVLSFVKEPRIPLMISNGLALKLIRAARTCEAVTPFSAEPQ